jgi:hypothetical protein
VTSSFSGMRKRPLVRAAWLLVVRWIRSGRQLWKCPVCLRVRRWGAEHVLDFYPMLHKMWDMPDCCRREFPSWAYRADAV